MKKTETQETSTIAQLSEVWVILNDKKPNGTLNAAMAFPDKKTAQSYCVLPEEIPSKLLMIYEKRPPTK